MYSLSLDLVVKQAFSSREALNITHFCHGTKNRTYIRRRDFCHGGMLHKSFQSIRSSGSLVLDTIISLNVRRAILYCGTARPTPTELICPSSEVETDAPEDLFNCWRIIPIELLGLDSESLLRLCVARCVLKTGMIFSREAPNWRRGFGWK